MRKRYFAVHQSLGAKWKLKLVENSATDAGSTMGMLILDIKALVLLHPLDDSLRSAVETELLNSHDEDIEKFLGMVQRRGHAKAREYFLAAIGELILAAFLMIAGLFTVAPAMMGLRSQEQLLNYFSEVLQSVSKSNFSSPLLGVFDFLIALGLLIAGFYSLRIASANIKETGLRVE